MIRRLFISAVSREFRSCRERLDLELRFPDVVVETQEAIARLATGTSILLKLDDYIGSCDAVINLLGAQTSQDGRAANAHAVAELLRRYPQLPIVTGLSEAELRSLSYTQWEAWLAWFHIQTTRPTLKLLIAVPTEAFQPDQPADPASALVQQQSQAWHAQALRERGRHPEIQFDSVDTLCIGLLRALKNLLPERQPAQHIAASRLVSRHTAADFFGRDAELQLLDAAWAAPERINVQCVIAWGGVGKTALLAHWVQTRFRDRGWQNTQGQPEPLAYFDWTFYDQGTRASDATQAGAASVGTFFVEALRHFGDPEPDRPDNKARRLAERVRAQRCLLVLDGLEPLQYPHNHPQAGQITDPDLAQLLRLLAQQHPGLCLISSREALSELGGQLASNAPHHDLEDLPPAAAIALLRKLGVVGSDADLARAATDYQHHALSLILLGRFLATARGGDIRQRDTLSFEKANDKRGTQTRSAWHVLETTERWLASPGGNPTDLQALRLIGLFDRPASPECLDALRQPPAIPGLTDLLVPLDHDDWNAVLQRLHEAQLIQLKFPPREPSSQAPHPQPRQVPVDAHPLVREYFAKRLREAHPIAFRSGHSRIFDYLCAAAPHQPNTRDDLEPLYDAITHGCRAERHQEALNLVFIGRILRGSGADDYFSIKKLGAIGSNLSAIAAFFELPWSRLSSNLNSIEQRWVFHQAGYHLLSLGRMSESTEPMRLSTAGDDPEETISLKVSLSLLAEKLGNLEISISEGYSAMAIADKTEPAIRFWQVLSRAATANSLHLSGRHELALAVYKQAMDGQINDAAQIDLLIRRRSFGYCELILAQAEAAAWRATSRINMVNHATARINSALTDGERIATHALKWSEEIESLFDIALNRLILAKVSLYRSLLHPPYSVNSSDRMLIEALEGLRRANRFDNLPKGLLTAAMSACLVRNHASAAQLLAEAQHIAERGPMPLYLADVHLHRARLVGMLPPNERAQHWPGVDPKTELAKARALIEKHGYWRRREELADAEAASKHWD